MQKVTLHLADIRQLVGQEQAALPLLIPSRRHRASQPQPEQDRLHSIGAGLLLCGVLGVRDDHDLCFCPQGKPRLTGPGPCFSLSHGGNYAVLAVFPENIGVDIEPIPHKMPVIPRRFLRLEELSWLEESPTPERFTQLWTRLESVLKADGRGLSEIRRDFSLLDAAPPWYIHTLCFQDHMISCAAESPFETEIKLHTIKELLQ